MRAVQLSLLCLLVLTISFFLMALQAPLAAVSANWGEDAAWIYLIRLAAFVILRLAQQVEWRRRGTEISS